MEFLRALEALRTPFFDRVFSLITFLGDETIILGVAFLLLWCVDKRMGYYIIYTTITGIMVNLFLKGIFSIPRPWVRDPQFTIVESAREAASGYSFPSGHTKNSTVFYGSIARTQKNLIVRLVLIAVIFLIGFSRMYLGVHTPADVIVSWSLGAALVFVMYPLVNKALEDKKWALILNFTIFALSVGVLLYAELAPLSLNAVSEFAEAGIKNAYTLLGVTLSMPIIWWVDRYQLKYETKAKPHIQVIKCVLGVAGILAIRLFLKEPLQQLFVNHHIASTVRYALMALFGGTVWPMTFKYWNKLGK